MSRLITTRHLVYLLVTLVIILAVLSFVLPFVGGSHHGVRNP